MTKLTEQTLMHLIQIKHTENGSVNVLARKIVVDPAVNVGKCFAIGQHQFSDFKANLPHGYYFHILQSVKRIAARKNDILAWNLNPYVVYGRA